MGDEGLRELQIIQSIEEDPTVSQRTLAKRMGIALGLTNAIIKRMVRKGSLKVRNIRPNRLAYFITPHGFAEKSRLVLDHMRFTVDYYRRTKQYLQEAVHQLHRDGVRSVAICGTDELIEILILCLREEEIELVCLFATIDSPQTWNGISLQPPTAADRFEFDLLIVADPACTIEKEHRRLTLEELMSYSQQETP